MSQSRQLAAIMFTDIVGYTALMANDEQKAFEYLKKNREIQKPIIEKYNGRWLKELGDGVMASFQTVSDAVNAAIKIQEACNVSKEFQLRIGIHLGEVVFENDDVFGDGVNIASRIQSIAIPGGIYISESVYNNVSNKQDIQLVSLGKYSLKNVLLPIQIFAVSNEGLVVPEIEKPEEKGKQDNLKKSLLAKLIFGILAISLIVFLIKIIPDGFFKLSSSDENKIKTLAILPFVNLSSSKDDDYFTNGMCDEILTQLSKIGSLNVLSQSSTLQFKDSKKSTKEIAEQIGANTLLQGSVQKSGDKIRIRVQLIDGSSNKQIWAETYDRELKDVFAIQTDIASQIAQELNATLTEKEKSIFSDKPTDNLQAYDFYLRGNNYSRTYWELFSMKDVPDAIRMYEQAIKLDPNFIEAYSALILLYIEISWNKLSLNSESYLIKGKEWLDKMLALKIDKPLVHFTLANYKYEGERDYAGALAEYDVVDKILGNDHSTYNYRAYILRRMGRLDEAIILFEKKAVLYPKDYLAQYEAAETFLMLRNFDKALFYADKAVAMRPDNYATYSQKASVYSNLKGDSENAKKVIKDASTFIDPGTISLMRIYFDLAEGSYDNAVQTLLNYPDSLNLLQSNIFPNSTMLGIIFFDKGDKKTAQKYFMNSFNLLHPLFLNHSEDFRFHSAIGICYAGLGNRDKALEAGNKAIELMPVSMDAILGQNSLESMAIIHTLLGNQDAAIDILEKLLKMPLGWSVTNSIPIYKNFPYWKTLQNNPRFQKMIQGTENN